MSFAIRPVSDRHVSQIAKLFNAAIQEAGATGDYSESQVAAWSRHHSLDNLSFGTYAIVAASGEEVLGVAAADLARPYHIRFVFVAPNQWRKGLGRTLVSCLEGFCADRGVRKIFVASALNAVPFYAALGYAACGSVTVCLPSEAGPEYIQIQAIEMSKRLESELPRTRS